MLTPADMERVLENLDRRLTAIEQILPTLARAEQVDRAEQLARTLNEQTNDRVRLIADGVADLTRRVDDLPTRQEFRALSDSVDDVRVGVKHIARALTTLTTRLEQKGVI